MELWAVKLVLLLMYVLVRYYYIVRFAGEGENDEKKKTSFPDLEYFFDPSHTTLHGATV
jgi:hypothetical protein